MATVTVSRQPLQPTTAYQLVPVNQQVQVVQTKRFDLMLVHLINEAHMPEASVVTDDQRRTMAVKMRQLRQILVGCQPTEPEKEAPFR